jgi:alanine racemase
VAAAVDSAQGLELAGAMTHFATADDEESGFFDEQLQRFRPFAVEVKRLRPHCIVHAANSAAVMRDAGAHFDMARCGIAIYGMDPFGHDAAARGLAPALALNSYVAGVKLLAPGESVGYGRTWAAPSETPVAVLPIGYGDGYRRGLSNAAEVLIRGRRFPVVGTISMDNITVAVDDTVAVGDRATLIGADGDERVTAEELARRLGTINFEITCGISARVPRVHLTR